MRKSLWCGSISTQVARGITRRKKIVFRYAQLLIGNVYQIITNYDFSCSQGFADRQTNKRIVIEANKKIPYIMRASRGFDIIDVVVLMYKDLWRQIKQFRKGSLKPVKVSFIRDKTLYILTTTKVYTVEVRLCAGVK